jgi:tetratricopeptide (TPR) repeat protein
MRAIFTGFVLSWTLLGQQSTKPPDTKPPAKQVEEPPEEDESLIPKECVLNPLEASKNIKAGDFYFKKPKYLAAANRYKEAICWDPSSAEAFLKLGETEEKLHNWEQARDAYQKYLGIVPEAKNASEIKKKLVKLLAK